MHIIIKRADGKVSHMYLVDENKEEVALNKWKLRYPGQYISHFEVDPSSLPEDNGFFNSWEASGNSVVINLSKAKDIQLDKLREARLPLLAAQDVLYMKALESGNQQDIADVVAEKERLRTVTENLKNANPNSLEDIKTLGSLDLLIGD